jgi:hypothetical protein
MFENGQKIYIYSSDFNGVEEWTYYTGYDDKKHMISDGKHVYSVDNDDELKKFYATEDECVNQLCEKYFSIQQQCKEKMDFLNKEIETLTKVVKDTQKNIKHHKANRTKLVNTLGNLMEDFKPIIKKYPELFI